MSVNAGVMLCKVSAQPCKDESPMAFTDRPGVTSRVRPAPGRKRRWHISETLYFPLPVIVDHSGVDPETREQQWLFEATIDLVEGVPALVRVDARVPGGFDTHRVQREFRWASPLEVVIVTVPQLLARGIDPFSYDLPVAGFPEAADMARRSNEPLGDAFLEDIARQYLDIGRGYAKVIANERHVSQRTVVSWVEKARRRGILTRVPPGSYGGQIVPRSHRGPG